MTLTPPDAPDPAEEPALLAKARQRDDREAIRRFLSGADEDRQRRELFRAAKEGYINVLEVFSESGILPLDARWPSGQTTPLMHAVMKSQTEAVRYLLAKNCSLTAQNGTGYTPLHVTASSAKDKEIVFMLALAGASFDTLNGENQTPLDVAGYKRRPEMRGWLMEAFKAQRENVIATERRRHEEFVESEAAVAHNGVEVKPMRALRFKSPQNRPMFAR
ncbi:MAG: ankyrin repeat domain-containing protein [Alphaproteobacteria bacterium]|nr:MAG: ankyrin repeat domain-containing protein [Alphaproteobacteria bacterium]